MPNKNKKQLTARECIAIAKKCRKRIAFGQGMMYVCNQTRPLWRERIRPRRGNCPQTQSPIGRGVKNFINPSNNGE